MVGLGMIIDILLSTDAMVAPRAKVDYIWINDTGVVEVDSTTQSYCHFHITKYSIILQSTMCN